MAEKALPRTHPQASLAAGHEAPNGIGWAPGRVDEGGKACAVVPVYTGAAPNPQGIAPRSKGPRRDFWNPIGRYGFEGALPKGKYAAWRADPERSVAAFGECLHVVVRQSVRLRKRRHCGAVVAGQAVARADPELPRGVFVEHRGNVAGKPVLDGERREGVAVESGEAAPKHGEP